MEVVVDKDSSRPLPCVDVCPKGSILDGTITTGHSLWVLLPLSLVLFLLLLPMDATVPNSPARLRFFVGGIDVDVGEECDCDCDCDCE